MQLESFETKTQNDVNLLSTKARGVEIMTLSARDLDIVGRAALAADWNIPRLSKHLGYRPHVVRHLLNRLADDNILRRVWLIDVLPLGWNRYQLLVSLDIPRLSLRSEFIKRFVQSPHVAFVSETAGDFDYELVILARNSHDFLERFRDISSTLGQWIFAKAISEQTVLEFFPRKHLAQKRVRFDHLSIGENDSHYELDELDHRLLVAMARTTVENRNELARRLAVSPVTIHNRLKQLRAAQVIKGALWSFSAPNNQFQNYKVLIYAKGIASELVRELRQFAREHPHVTNYRHGLGTVDFELGVEVGRYDQLLTLKEQLGARFGSRLNSIKILSRLTIHKYKPYPFEEKFETTALASRG